jgi:beta-1,4-mannosyl-glycoprotein beta-1,4-N-acetylglucosaminyltransferase
MKLLDRVLFFKEFDVFELRLGILYDHVERFVVIESDVTFSGKPKPFYFTENRKQFLDPQHKIWVYRNHRAHCFEFDPWKEEAAQRNYDQVYYGDGDFVLMSDVDEIPNPDEFHNLKSGDLNIFEQKIYYYTINNRIRNLPWLGTRAVDVSSFSQTPQEYRDQRGGNIIKNGGWHFSYLGDSDLMKEKVEAFSHQEYNDEYHKGRIAERVLNNQDLFGRDGIEFEREEINSDNYPKYVLENIETLCKKSLVY